MSLFNLAIQIRFRKSAIGFLVAVFLLPVSDSVKAQTIADDSWQSEAKSRFEAIYDRGDFRPAQIQTRWAADGATYSVRRRDSETNRMVWATFKVSTGERVDGESDVQTRRRDPLKSPDGKSALEFRGRNLFVRNIENGESVKLTDRPADRDVSYRSPRWSPNGDRIVFVEADQTDVPQRTMLVPSDPSYPGTREQRFARVGEKITVMRIGVVNSNGENLQWLPVEMPEEGVYLGQVEWAQNSEEVLVERLSRYRDRREFLLVNINGNIKTIFSESDDAWAVGSQGKNSGLNWIQDGKSFVVVSEKDGWRHAFLYSREGNEIGTLTAGEYDLIDRAAIDERGGWYYFYASPNNATQKHLFRVPLEPGKGTSKPQRITPEDQPGTHNYRFSPDFRWAVHTHSTLNSPPRVEIVSLPDHKQIRVLEDNSEVRDRLKATGTRPAEFLELEIGNGVSVDAWMIKPNEFDETKKYPVFVYVYGEPYAQTVLDQWGAAQIDFHRAIADLGYVVISIDNRGTPAPKGAAWRRSIAGSLGPLSTEEQGAALKAFAKAKPFADLSRVGIWGWSGGGSNTLNAMFRKPDSYHVGIAVVPKPQPHLYNAWFQEIYMRDRKVNPEGYRTAAAINYANGLKGKLLIVTGSGETNTHIQIIEGLVDRLIELGKPFDYMVYPNRDHGLREGKGTTVHVRMLIARYLLENLPPGAR